MEQKRNFTDLFSLSSHIWQKAIVPIFREFQLFHYYCNFSYSLLLLSLHVSNMEQITLKKNIKDRRVRIDNLQKYFLSLSFLSGVGEERKIETENQLYFPFFFFLTQLESFHCHCKSTVCPKCSDPWLNVMKANTQRHWEKLVHNILLQD